MTLRQKIWSIPLVTMLIFSIGMAVISQSSSKIYGLLQRTDNIYYPYLSNIQDMTSRLGTIQERFLDAIDSNYDAGIVRVRLHADVFRKVAADIAELEGKKEISRELLLKFNDYFTAAERAASIIAERKNVDASTEVGRMTVLLNNLKDALYREQRVAAESFEHGLNDSKRDVLKMLWVGLLIAFAVLAGLAFISYRLISSILVSLERLRAVAERIARGDFTARLSEVGQDELTVVARGFNTMGEELQIATEKSTQYQKELETLNFELEDRVVIRTSELAIALDLAHKANADVAFMADHDSLTGLLSRRKFQEELVHWSKFSLRYDRPMALLFIDLDKFKNINDSYGHMGGDEYLNGVATLLKKTLRATDYIGRWGGDEFAALLPEITTQTACEVAAKLIRVLDTTSIAVGDATVFGAASIGIAVMPDHARDITELISYADAAMYKAKAAGRGCFNLYTASENEISHINEYTVWARRIRLALETDQFVLFYQPLLNLESGMIVEYEALLRLEDHSGEFIGPDRFLASAERFDLSLSIDRMVIRKAISKIAALRTQKKRLQISLNVSAKFMDDPGLVEYIQDVLTEMDVDPNDLALEISESAILQNLEQVLNLSERLKAAGLGLILDDIAVGFSSFSYLAPLSIRSIKIRGDLIVNLDVGDNSRYIRELCKTCNDLGIAVVAKHVEEMALIGRLREIGIGYAQGFAVGRPLESMQISD